MIKTHFKFLNESNKVNPKAFTNYSQAVDDVCEHLEGYNPTKKRIISSVWWYDIRYGS